MRRTMTVLGLGLSAALLAGGCGLITGGHGGDGGKATGTSSPGKRNAQAASSPQASGRPSVSRSVRMTVPGKPGQTFTIGYSGLKVTGRLARLTLVWTPHGVGTDTVSPYDMVGGSTSGSQVTLIDTANLKRYVVVKDSDQDDLQSDYVGTETGNDQPLAMSYTFAAPPAGAAIDVVLNERPLFESVPVTR